MATEVGTRNYEPPANGFRTFLIIWTTQTFSVFGSQLTYFAVTIWLSTVLVPIAVTGLMQILFGVSSWLYLTALFSFLLLALIPTSGAPTPDLNPAA